MPRDFILIFLMGKLQLCSYYSNGGGKSPFLKESLEKEYDTPRCIHYNQAEGEMSWVISVCIDLQWKGIVSA